jgi:hypothetical protein
VDVGKDAKVPEVPAVSIFMVEVWRMVEFLCMYRFVRKSHGRRKVGVLARLGYEEQAVGQVPEN